LIKNFDHNANYISKLLNTEDLRNIQPLFLLIYLRQSYRNTNDEKRAILLNIIKLFVQYHVKIRIRNEEQRTPLEVAVSYVRFIYKKIII